MPTEVDTICFDYPVGVGFESVIWIGFPGPIAYIADAGEVDGKMILTEPVDEDECTGCGDELAVGEEISATKMDYRSKYDRAKRILFSEFFCSSMCRKKYQMVKGTENKDLFDDGNGYARGGR